MFTAEMLENEKWREEKWLSLNEDIGILRNN
jgi:hypothetical protein